MRQEGGWGYRKVKMCRAICQRDVGKTSSS